MIYNAANVIHNMPNILILLGWRNIQKQPLIPFFEVNTYFISYVQEIYKNKL